MTPSVRSSLWIVAVAAACFANPLDVPASDDNPSPQSLTACEGTPLRAGDNDVTRALILTQNGATIEGDLVSDSLQVMVGEQTRSIALREIKSLHSGAPASPHEAQTISEGLATLAGTDLAACEATSAALTDIGLPVLTPLLKSFQDTDAHEPDYRYRLFGRIVPGVSDDRDRTLDLVRLANGETLRGKWTDAELKYRGSDGKETSLPVASIRRIAAEQANISKSFDLQALHDCTYVGFLDTGIIVASNSALKADCEGFIRLSFDEDGWASDPDGIKETLPGKRKLQEGFRWGAVLGRVGPSGERWMVGSHLDKDDLGAGRLYFVINDNDHWQNNIGRYRVRLTVTNAYDVGDPQ